MAKDYSNAKKPELSLSLVSANWRTAGGGVRLELSFQTRVPTALQSEKGMIKGDAHGEPFEVPVADNGPTIVYVSIRVLSEQPRVNATLEIGGQTVSFSKDVPYEPPKDAIAVDLLTNVYAAELGGAKVLMLAVGVRLTSNGRGVPARDVFVTVGDLPEQKLPTDTLGRAEGYFGPVTEGTAYDVSVTSLGVSKRQQRIVVPKQRPPMQYRFEDSKASNGVEFSVACTLWRKDTGEAVNGHKVTVRVGNQKPQTQATVDGFVSIGPFAFDKQSRLTSYTVFVEGFPPQKGSIKAPSLLESTS